MDTIITLAKALAAVGHTDILRLDIQYNYMTESYKGRVTLDISATVCGVFDIYDDGTIKRISLDCEV